MNKYKVIYYIVSIALLVSVFLLIGKTPTIVGQVFGTDNWEVVDVDEEWVKLRRVNKKGKEKFKLQRIEDIQTVEFDGK